MNEKFLAQVGQINQRLQEINYGDQPTTLYDPIRYIMALGGKRMRPLLALLSYELYKDDPETILDQAIAIEVFHNFTLMHDDIMDKAPLRRGKPTVHEKWDSNVAILSGDVMLIKAYDLLLQSSSVRLKEILRSFNECAIAICEGQQLDMGFEALPTISEEDYLHMVRKKTAVLLGFSLQLGAMLAEASIEDAKALYAFGCEIGIGFQLKDDLLDVYADQSKFGKQVGGDIIANKKTFLLLKALELASPVQKERLDHWLNTIAFNPVDKVREVVAVYNELKIRQITENKINECFEKGFQALESLSISRGKKQLLEDFTNALIHREK